MTMMCDLCVAADNTRFIYPEAKLGIAIGMVAGMAVRVPHKVAVELMLLGGPLTAQRAYDVGFVDKVVAVGEQLAAAKAMATTLAGSAPLVLAMLKRLVRDTLPQSPIERMYSAQRQIDHIRESDDALEGLAAFREKRPPSFTGS